MSVSIFNPWKHLKVHTAWFKLGIFSFITCFNRSLHLPYQIPPLSVICTLIHPHEDYYLQCSLFSVQFVEGCPLWEGSVPGLLWEPLLRVALPDDVVPLQEAICCLSSVDTVTMHSSEGSEAAAAHELCMWAPMLCRDFIAGVWAIEWMVEEGVWQRIQNETSSNGPFSLNSLWKWILCKTSPNLPSVLVSLRLGRVPTFSVWGLWPVSGALLCPRLCVPCAPWSAVPKLSEWHCWEPLPKSINEIKVELRTPKQVFAHIKQIGPGIRYGWTESAGTKT